MKTLTRREFIKLSLVTGSAAALAACQPAAAPAEPAATTAPEEGGAAEAPKLDLPFEIAPEAVNPLKMPDNTKAEGIFFSGGYGHAYIQYAADLFAKVHPGSSMSVEGIQGVGEKLRPRFVGGNPPDCIDNSGAGALDMGALMSEGQLLDLAPLFNAPSLDTPGKTVIETLFPGSQDNGVMDGKQVALEISYTVGGIWYSKTLFEKKGWTYPATWDEMLALCDKIKTEGEMAPWTYQGKYPSYMEFGVLQGQIFKRGGMQPMIDIDNLVDKAWYADAVYESVKEIYTLAENDYIMAGTEGLNHTESQAEWLKGKAAFIPCGTWLENEMKTTTPEGFDMVMGEVPGEGHACLAAGGEPFIVPAKGKNPEAGMELLRCLISKDSAKWFAENISAMMPVVGGTEGANVSAGMQSAVKVVADVGKNTFPFLSYGGWYTDLSTESSAKMGELLTKKITVDQFVEAVQKKADAVKADPEVTKFTRTK
jgi:N-acetylglucosamine transport system substrate-binding protein